MAYVQTAKIPEDNAVSVKIRDRLARARIVPFPFYDPEKYGFKRKLAAST
jgi:glycine cleavage system aminomethyltransferase T